MRLCDKAPSFRAGLFTAFVIAAVTGLIGYSMHLYNGVSELQRLCFAGCGSRGVTEFNESGHSANKTNCVCGPAVAGSAP